MIIIPIGLITSLIRLCVACCGQKEDERALRRQEEFGVESEQLIQEELHSVHVPQHGYDFFFVQPSTVLEYPQPIHDRPPDHYTWTLS